jgi:hypothetical protein
MRGRRFLAVALGSIVVASVGPLRADVRTSGQVEGAVQREHGAFAAYAVLTLGGQGLVRESKTSWSSTSGVYTFLNLNPGKHEFLIPVRPSFLTVLCGVGRCLPCEPYG